MAPLFTTTLLLASHLPLSLGFSPKCTSNPLITRKSPPPHTSHHHDDGTSLFAKKSSYGASTVVDPHGPTPPVSADPFPTVDLNDLPQAHYDESNHPIPHQPWRRGDTDGCHDPISAPWRMEAETIVRDAAQLVGAKVVDVTWYMAKMVISLDESSLNNVVSYVDGPEVRIVYPDKDDVSGHIFHDPDAGTENEYYTEEDELLDYEQYDEETEYEILKANMPQEYDEETGEMLPPREPRSREERMMEMQEELEERLAEESREEKPADGMFAHAVDTKALSVVSQAIITALSEDEVEDSLQVISRHDIILTSPLNNPCILDSQSEFDAARNKDVYIETRDPWGSNRVLGGKLVDRNAMDVIINQDNSGRMVTVPNSMVHQVLCVSGLAVGSERMRMENQSEDGEDGEGDDDLYEDDDGGDYDDVEEEDFYE
ncbi:predicted protein [Thalassiosira pseudonana CCMP1335]|uniref:Uncharacterized protein n=1 Tax=Thalassiosira pseudonana TaxID=35128 RepID=B8CF04_THAPS|nr:predicted protein [Thalassiosira pseudonana CCMP1335]EED88125.1 predicted protein [Thalassiosira pseudonana CCMP1335]